ncbi:MAG: hypothetical protein ORN54_11770 [Cyclobacteriaceae bacterium]|nr:hypothetical protein [Cyclobacteriaceae bacterium]
MPYITNRFIGIVFLTLALSAHALDSGECQSEGGSDDRTVYIRAMDKIVALPPKVATVLNDINGTSMLGYLFTFGAVKAKGSSFIQITGDKASVRIIDKQPDILDILIPIGKPPWIQLYRLTSKDGNRLALLASAEVGLLDSSGKEGTNKVELIPKKLAICSFYGAQFQHYRFKPATQLEPGEYGLYLGDKMFDFGVD